MAAESAPAYQWYVKDWRSSRKVQRMTFAERGMYREMLDEQWEQGSLPATPDEMADLLGGTKAEWTRAWPALSACFSKKKRDGRLVNVRLEAVRRERRNYLKAQRENGLRGAKARWKKHGDGIGSPSARHATAMAKNGSSSSTATASSSATAGTGPPTTARSKRPIFSGQRLVVFEWQVDDLTRLLGSHTDAFDLDLWFARLDAEAIASACVIPQRDGGAWLQAQTLAEAQRRGLPIAIGSNGAAAGKQTTRLAAAVANIQTEGA